MTKWIAFDDASVSALSRRTGAQTELGVGDALAVALSAEAPALVMLPGVEGGVMVITVAAGEKQPARESPRYVASGFLGLTDELATEEQPQEERPSWWRRWFRR
ncbi:MAG: hypothetical protein ACE14L_17930 [Terriglobales bacterium]